MQKFQSEPEHRLGGATGCHLLPSGTFVGLRLAHSTRKLRKGELSTDPTADSTLTLAAGLPLEVGDCRRDFITSGVRVKYQST